MKKINVLLTSLFLAACSITNPAMDKIMTSWVGSDIDQVIKQWGFPDDEKTINQRKIYIWSQQDQYQVPGTTRTTGRIDPYTGNYSSQTTTSPGYTIDSSCIRILEVDQTGKVISWQWKGNNCPTTEWFKYKRWYNKQSSVHQEKK